MLENKKELSLAIRRVRTWYGALMLVLIIFGVRLFYVQVIRYDHYHAAALSDQLKQYQIPATRGLIEAHDGNNILPIVLNQPLYTLYADPPLIKNKSNTSNKIQSVIGGDSAQYYKLIGTPNTQYVILAKKLSEDQSRQILKMKLPGIGTQSQDYRTYPQNSTASQILGFVNNEGVGEYGIEQAFNKQLQGTPGQVKAVTDASGVPLAASRGNIETPPINGANVVTSINLPMQVRMEQILQQDYKNTKSQGLSAIIMDPYTGKIKAMANYPTFDPANYASVSDPSVFGNAAVSNPIEPGSIMKLLTTAAALNQGVIQPNTSFYDPAHWNIDGFNITDIEEDGGARSQNIASILNLSLNTGATWMLMQMGGGQINSKARTTWHDYMSNRFQFGKATNIEQGYEANGRVPDSADNGAGIDLTYANTSFGQGVLITALQMAAADSSMLNGGTYYQPSLIDQIIHPDGHTENNLPKVIARNVVSPKVSQEMVPLMQNVVEQHLKNGFPYLNFSPNYIVGGKTGTAQIAQPGGGYYSNKFNGTYAGFVGGNKPQYVIIVYNLQPNVAGYAGSYGGQPVFADLAHMLIDNSYVAPKN